MAAREASGSSESFWLFRSLSPILFLAVALTAAGIYAFFRTPIAVFPATNFPRIVIAVDNGVMPVEEMQVTITKPIEDAVSSVPGLATVRSTTSRGSAEVSLFFDWSVDMAQTLQLVNAALSDVRQTLPSTATIAARRLTFASFPILGYSLTSNTLSQTELWELATYTLKPPLNRVAGVSTITVQGGAVPEFHVIPDMAKMETSGVTIPQLLSAIQESNIIDSPGLYRQDHQLVLALVGAQAHDAEDLERIMVKTTASGAPVKVADVAEIVPGTTPVYTAVRANDQPAVLLTIARQPRSNTVAVADGVDAEIAQLRSRLPRGVKIQTFYDQSQLVRESIRSVRDAILIGLALACGVLFFFLRDLRTSLIAGLVIPVTVAVTVLVLWSIGQSFNLMTLGGLAAAIGLVIDDAIVVVENIVLHRDAGERRSEAVRKALHEILHPLIGSTITPVVVFLPLVAVTGVTGSFFRALAITMAVALLSSLLLAVSFTPSLALLLLSDRTQGRAHGVEADESSAQEDASRIEYAEVGPCLRRILDKHRSALGWSLRRPLWLGVGCLLLAGAAFIGYRSLGSDLLPEMDEGGFILDYVMPAGSSIAETNRVLAQVHQILASTPEVENTTRRTGLQMGFAAVTEANTGDITVMLKKDRHRGIDAVMADVRARIKRSLPQLEVEFTQVLQDNIGDLSNAPQPIQIKLFSSDQALLDRVASRVGEQIGKIDGVVDVDNGIDSTVSGPATSFQVNPQLAARFGFTPVEVAEDATAILDGIPVSNPLIANGRPYTVRVRLGNAARENLQTIRDTVFNSNSGHLASLGSMTQIVQLPPQNEILRENLQQLVTVTARLEGTDLGTAVKRVQACVQGLHLPPSVRVVYGGTYQEQQQSFAQLLRVLILAMVLVFGVLLTEFRNFAAPVAILASSVLSIAGVVGALLLTGTTFNVASFMGLIMVIGIVAKNGILLLDADQRFQREGASPREAMMMAAQRRLRPILMTALAAVCGMLPLALAIGAGSQMLRPLAIAVIGGLTISMLLSLIVTPVVYYLLTHSSGARTAEGDTAVD